MNVPLTDVRPNPFRNIDRYPINREKVDKLKESIGRTDFWDNIVGRAVGSGDDATVVEIAYGHHRLVALRELYPPEHEVGVIVRDLADAEMLHMMADENMQEWASTGAVIVETVRAVRDFLADLAAPPNLGHGAKPENGSAIVAFLGWPEKRVREALSIINAEEAGTLKPEDTVGLDLAQATALRQHVSRISEPAVRKQAIARVREDVREGRVGYRGIGDVVREVRAAASTPVEKPVIAAKVAQDIYSDIDNFWRVAIDLNGHGRLTRAEVIRLIATNRAARELNGIAGPWSEQIAIALMEMARTAEKLAAVLRTEEAVEVVS